ncbi:MerR family transcriptional regulator [Rhizobium sp. 2YAF20]|jgi:DNA-binding transcriptional MerR regulator|uniref:MerR family transcriptional regulator n=1 Tax=Rhizobium sp. 2YAF20 TaxID=3233027 RepID=UPI003F99EBF2
MPDGSKRLFAAAKLASEARAKYRFLPAAALPPDLPSGPIAIADMANAFGVTHRTLHFYEEKGLISADRIGLMRVYGLNDVLRMAVINICRETGMSIAVIQEMMEELHKAETQEAAEDIFHNALFARKRELTSEMSTLHRQMQLVTELLDYDSAAETDRLNDNRDQSALTDQERRCLELMVEGQSTVKIAREMEIRLEEAQALEAAVIQKFGTNNRFQAVAKAVLLGIVKT